MESRDTVFNFLGHQQGAASEKVRGITALKLALKDFLTLELKMND